MRTSYNKTTPASPPTELNTRPPGYTALEKRLEVLEKLVGLQAQQLETLLGMLPTSPAA